MTLQLILFILFTHYVSDFIFQTHEQSMQKSSDNFALTGHVITYTLGLLIASIFLISLFHYHYSILLWVPINGALHWITDYFTSRINKRLWEKGKVHRFFVGIGADQMIHYIILFTTFDLIAKWPA